jgi:hypothetical protein
MGEDKDYKPEIIMHSNAANNRFDKGKLVRAPTCARSTKCRSLKLIFSLIDVACVTAFVLCSGVPRIFSDGGSTNSVEDRGQRERGS